MGLWDCIKSLFKHEGGHVSIEPTQSAQSNTPPEPKNPNARTYGFDCSHWNSVDWDVAKRNFDYVYCKSTQGLSDTDSKYVANRKAAKLRGLLFGAYHFIMFDQDGKAQADHFVDFLLNNGGLDPEDFVVLDWETKNSSPATDHDSSITRAFVDQVKARLKRISIVYSNDLLNQEKDTAWLLAHPNIIADFHGDLDMLKPWTNWNFWQNADSTGVDQVHGDHDIFRGDVDDLRALIAYTNVGTG